MPTERDPLLTFFAINTSDLDDPLGIISEVCQFDSLFGTREHMFELYMLAMASPDWHTDSAPHKGSRMYRLKLMIQMVEVVYLLNHLHKTDQLRKIINAPK
jgi:hypothetical protein